MITPRFVVALWPEARPLVERLGLRPVAAASAFRHFRGERGTLVVSGVGKTRAAAAAAYLYAVEGEASDRPWINVGIAGHQSLALGQGVLATRVVDVATGRVWHPYPAFAPPAPCGTVHTFDQPVDDYPPETACDMEAAGFVDTSVRFSPLELVHVYKVVSDGPGQPWAELTPSRVSDLVAGQVDAVADLAQALCDQASELARAAPAVDVETWGRVWRLTVTQRRQLERLLARLAVVEGQAPGPKELVPPPSDGRALIGHLEKRLAGRTESVG